MSSRREETTRESRDILVATATKLFAERGFRKTTFADIAEHSGISRGSIPWHFGNKDGLLAAVIDNMMSAIEGQTQQFTDVDEAVARVIDFIRQPDSRLLITLVAEAVEPDSPVHAFYANLHTNFRRWVNDWTANIDLPPAFQRDNLDVVIIGAIIGLHQQWRISPDSIDLEGSVNLFKALLVGL